MYDIYELEEILPYYLIGMAISSGIGLDSMVEEEDFVKDVDLE